MIAEHCYSLPSFVREKNVWLYVPYFLVFVLSEGGVVVDALQA